MSWCLDDVLKDYPFNVTSTSEKTISDTPMSHYTRWNIDTSFRHFLHNRGTRRKKDFLTTFSDVFSMKYPTAKYVTPFILYWLLQTGSNPEGVVNMRRKEKTPTGFVHIGEISPLGDTPVIRSFKNRGSKNYYWFVLNPNERNGLYSHFTFLKSFLSLLWHEDDIHGKKKNAWPFWVYYSPMKAQKVIHIDWSNLKYQLNDFIKEHKIIMPDGTIMTNIEPSRLRNTFITMADLQNLSIEEIQELIKHGNFDTRFKFYGNSPDLRSKNFRHIYAIQEDIIEQARHFMGVIEQGSLKNSISQNKVTATYLCGCSNIKNPAYDGARKTSEHEICVDWDMCLLCPQSRVFYEHLPRICARILQYEEYQKKMTADEWENNFGIKRQVARDALKKWISDGGSQEDIDMAWERAKSGEIYLPPIFPSGQIAIKSDTDAA